MIQNQFTPPTFSFNDFRSWPQWPNCPAGANCGGMADGSNKFIDTVTALANLKKSGYTPDKCDCDDPCKSVRAVIYVKVNPNLPQSDLAEATKFGLKNGDFIPIHFANCDCADGWYNKLRSWRSPVKKLQI